MQYLPSKIPTDQCEGLTLNEASQNEVSISENVVSLPVTAYHYISNPCQSETNRFSKNRISTTQHPLKSYTYTRTGNGSACEDGAKVLFTIGHRPTDKCKRLPDLGHHNCGKATCSRPECYEAVIRKQAREGERRLKGFKDLEEFRGVSPGKEKQLVFSPWQDKNGTVILGKGRNKQKWTKEQMIADGARQYERHLYKIMKEGFQGGYYAGVIVTHMERKKHTDGTECERDGCTRKHVWRWGPHTHFIGYGHMVDSEYFHDRTNWIYRNVKPGKPRDLYQTILYALSHSAHFHKVDSKGNRRSRPAYRNVGLISSYRMGQLVVAKYDEQQLCQCQEPLHKYAVPEGFALDSPEISEYYKQEDLGPYLLARNDKSFYQKLRYRSHCLGRHTFIYPDTLAEKAVEKIERGRRARFFKAEVDSPIWVEPPFLMEDLRYSKSKKARARRPKWSDHHSVLVERLPRKVNAQ